MLQQVATSAAHCNAKSSRHDFAVGGSLPEDQSCRFFKGVRRSNFSFEIGSPAAQRDYIIVEAARHHAPMVRKSKDAGLPAPFGWLGFPRAAV